MLKVRHTSQFVKGYLRAAKCYSQRGMLWEAKDMISKVSQRDPANAEAAKELVTLDQVGHVSRSHTPRDV